MIIVNVYCRTKIMSDSRFIIIIFIVGIITDEVQVV